VRVLVADRDPRFTVRLSRHFARQGWEVAAAADAPRALDRAGTLRPNVIVLDLELSDGEGMVLLQLLKAAPSTRLIPVVALSASDETIMEQMARARGAARFARKPIDPARVSTIVGALDWATRRAPA
jgi:CheY-like chemotaxis protein